MPASAPSNGIDLSDDGLDRVRRQLFAQGATPVGDPLDEVELFSAPGEGREAVEIARRVLREARAGTAFDQMAIALRAPQQYAGLLEHALERAGVPAYFERGSRRPHPAGRAFLALIACAQENLSARRFAEYLSLGQVPDRGEVRPTDAAYPTSQDEVFGALADRADQQAAGADQSEPTEAAPRAFRAPWKWERLIAESRVVSSGERWERRLNGLMAECRLQQDELARTDPESRRRVEHLTRKIEDLQALEVFALPIMRALADWPARARWTEWLDAFEALAPRVLARPERVLRVLADLRPMGTIGPVSLDEAARVLTGRLSTIESEPPPRRYGRVFVASPSQLRGRTFDVVFVPALAERMFPQRPREDPLLLDAARHALDASLPTQADRSEQEKQHLRLAVGAAVRKLYVSFPTVETGEGRPRVPSLYALEVWRAMTGRVPSADELQQAAARASQATLAWPAPSDSKEAIDALEHDLATLRRLVDEPDHIARGRAQYILQLNGCLQRSVRERYMRDEEAVVALGRYRSGQRTDAADPGGTSAGQAGLLALGTSALCDLSVPVPARRHLPDAPRRGSRAAPEDGPADQGQPVPCCADGVLPRHEGDGSPARQARAVGRDASRARWVRGKGGGAGTRSARTGHRARVGRRDRRDPARPPAVGRPDRSCPRRVGAEPIRVGVRPEERGTAR